MKNKWNKILNELSYRVSTGIPDLSNEQHLMKLWDILKEHNWNLDARVELLKNLEEAVKPRYYQADKGQSAPKGAKVGVGPKGGTYYWANPDGSAADEKEIPEGESADNLISLYEKFSDKKLSKTQIARLERRFNKISDLDKLSSDEIFKRISGEKEPDIEPTTSTTETKQRAEKHRVDVFEGKKTGPGTVETTQQEELANIGREIANEPGFKEPPPLAEQIIERVKRDYPDTKLAKNDKLLKRLAKKSDAGAKTMERLKNNPGWNYAEEQPDGHPIHTTDTNLVRDELMTKLKQAEEDGDEEAIAHYKRELYFYQKKATKRNVTGKEGDADTVIMYTDKNGRTKAVYVSNKQTIGDQLNSSTLNSSKEAIIENVEEVVKSMNLSDEQGKAIITKTTDIVEEQYRKSMEFSKTYTENVKKVADDKEKRNKLKEPGISKAISIAASVDQGASGKKKFTDDIDEDRSQKYTRNAQEAPEVQAQLLGEEPAPNNDPKSKEYKKWKKGITKKWDNRDREYDAEETIQATIDATGTGALNDVGDGSKAAPYSLTRATLVTRDLRNRVQKLVDGGMSVKEACKQVSGAESPEGKLYGGKFSADDVEEIYNSKELKELEDAERQRGKDIADMYDATTKQLKEEDEKWAKENGVKDIPPKNGPHTQSYVRGWLQRSHLTDMIRGTYEGQSLMEVGDQPVSPKDFRKALSDLLGFDGDPDDIEALEQHIVENLVPSEDSQELVYRDKDDKEVVVGKDTHRTDGRKSKVVAQYGPALQAKIKEVAKANKGK